jgi:hypothetical protein
MLDVPRDGANAKNDADLGSAVSAWPALGGLPHVAHSLRQMLNSREKHTLHFFV